MGLRKPYLRLSGMAAVLGVAALAAPAVRAQQTAYAIANGGTTLITFQTNNPGGAVAVGDFTLGGVATFLDGIDFRPANSQLYGYLDATNTLYQVNLATAALTPVATSGGASATNTNLLGLDFNPTIDRLRVVTDSGQNLVYNPNTSGAATVATALFYPAGDPGASAPLGPRVIENAYTNNITGAFATTTQYAIDYGRDTLLTLANNAGTLTTIGALGLDINDAAPFVGFDIFTALGGLNTAYALLDTTPGLAPGLYTINLTTGAATATGAVGGGFTQVYSLAVTPTASAVPEPGTLALAALGLLPLAGTAIRRRA